jgi:sporulation integral membrane protein YtvI
MQYAFWLFFPFLFALFVAMGLQRPINFLVKKTKIKKGAASFLCVFALLAVILSIIMLIGIKIETEIQGLIKTFMVDVKDLPDFYKKSETTLINAVHFLPVSIKKYLDTWITDLYNKLNSKTGFKFNFSSISSSLGGVWSTAKMLPKFFIAVLIVVVSCFFLTSDYDRIINFIKRQLPRSKRDAVSLTKRTMFSSVGKLVKAYAILMFIAFCEMLLGLAVLRMAGLYKSNFLLATATIIAMIDLIPYLGPSTVFAWALYSLLSGSTGFGIGLLVILVLMYVVRQILEPKLVSVNLGLRPIVTLMGIYIGLELFGFIGVFLVPLTIMCVKMLNDNGVIKLWKNLGDVKPETKEPAAKEEVPAAKSD